LGARKLSIVILALSLSAAACIVYAQEPRADASLESNRQPPRSVQAPNGDYGTTILRVTTREVLIDVIAIDSRGQLAVDLGPADLQVSETSDPVDLGSEEKHRKVKTMTRAEHEPITSLRLVDPNAPQVSGDIARGGLQIWARCLDRATQHYQLAFRPGPDGWRSGNHKVAIKTTRHGVKLFYRPLYYIGLTTPKPAVNHRETVDKSLRRAACNTAETPPSISLRARWIDTGRADLLRYSVSIDAASLSFVTSENEGPGSRVGTDRSVELDYGVCTFDSRGGPIHFFHSPLDTVLTSADYARALDRGFPHILEFPAPEDTAMTRLVVRDRQTGNLGTIDVPYPRLAEGRSSSQRDQEIRGWDYPQLRSFDLPALQVQTGSFGSIVPNLRSFCGDVYELPRGIQNLPDYRYLDPIGSVYTSVLDVPDQVVSNNTQMPGFTPSGDPFGRMPGSTPIGDPFGIDYHGVLWITKPGNYSFQILSDDGAILRVDDRNLINVDGTHAAQLGSNGLYLDAGRHSIEVRYYEDGLGAIALKLMVKQPGARSWTLLDMRYFAPPLKE
jgi:hypothetical protein